tara:strand:+ start:12753 stop:13097 length:345 start_codon:yes stop_codon:yes gene_type:complete
VSQVVEGLMGIEPDAANHTISTIPRLPKEIGFLELTDLKIGEHTITVRQASKKTEITNSSGDATLICKIRFYGNHEAISVNNQKTKASTALLNGEIYSFITVKLKAGEKVIASI